MNSYFDPTPTDTIESTIGYTFKNKALLRQAFTRKSYTQEQGGQNNELLEFIGDKVLDLAVVKMLATSLGEINAHGEYCAANGNTEGDYTQIKATLVERKSLAARMRTLNLARFLLTSVGDAMLGIREQDKVQEDLFEAIIGAVALDSSWNMEAVSDVTERMLGIGSDLSPIAADFEENPVNLVQEWMQGRSGSTPAYEFLYDEESNVFTAFLTQPILGRFFSGEGASKSLAREEAAWAALKHIREKDIPVRPLPDDASAYTEETAINRLQELVQKGYVKEMPIYDFAPTPHLLWECTCSLPSLGLQTFAEATTKKEAKKSAALQMLLQVSKKIL